MANSVKSLVPPARLELATQGLGIVFFGYWPTFPGFLPLNCNHAYLYPNASGSV
jgi:hypothetical protein